MFTLLSRTALILALCLSCGGGGGSRGDGGDDGSAATGDGATAKGDASGSSGDAGSSSTGNGAVGFACDKDSDCKDPPDAKCWKTIGGGLAPKVTFPGGFCSKGCDPSKDKQCGTSKRAGCVSSGSGGGSGSTKMQWCTTSCAKDSDCRQAEGYKCKFFLFIGYCAPPGM